MIIFLGGLLKRAQSFLRPRYHYTKVEELPDELYKYQVYILGEGRYSWSIALLCPCGCGDTIQLNVRADEHPFWSYSTIGRQITISPSIWRKIGCRSHFILKKSRVFWCSN